MGINLDRHRPEEAKENDNKQTICLPPRKIIWVHENDQKEKKSKKKKRIIKDQEKNNEHPTRNHQYQKKNRWHEWVAKVTPNGRRSPPGAATRPGRPQRKEKGRGKITNPDH